MNFTSTVQFENNVMVTAWNLARESFNNYKVGNVKQYFNESLKMAWELFKVHTKNESLESDIVLHMSNYMDRKLITMVQKNDFYERMESLKKYKGKEIKRKDLFFEKVKEGYLLTSKTMMVTGGKYLTKDTLTKDDDFIFGFDMMDLKYIAYLIRNIKRV